MTVNIPGRRCFQMEVPDAGGVNIHLSNRGIFKQISRRVISLVYIVVIRIYTETEGASS
jgi:hypothetical protein